MRFLLSSALILIAFSCNTTAKLVPASDNAPLMVYKTKADYSKLVPVILSADKSEIVSYPHPNDIKSGDDLRLPLKLKKGYLLDQQGINAQVAFLSMTYQQYARMSNPLNLDSMFALIKDADPLLELYQVGVHGEYEDPEKEINALIKKGELAGKGQKLK